MKPDHMDMRREANVAYMESNGCEFLLVVYDLKCI